MDMNERLKKFGKTVKVERIRNDITQEHLAEMLNVSTRTVSLIENGLQHPKFFLAADMVKILHININDFIDV